MKKSIKILSLILSVLTLFSVFSVATPVFATEVTRNTSEDVENIDDITVSSEETETEENEEAEIVSEMENMRTEYTKYFRMSDGSYMAAQYIQPVHYEENGEWKEYDYSITENTNESEFVIENSDNEISFPEEFTEDEAQIEVSAREYDIKFSPVVEKKLFNKNSKGKVKEHKKLKSNEIIEEFLEEAPIDESADKNSEKLKIDNQKSAIAYEEVYDKVDLEYEISSNQIKESIVLNSKQDKNKFEFIVDTDGLFPKKEDDGSITLYEDKEYQKPVSSIMKPYMYDANGEHSYDVTMDIKEKKDTYILTVKADNNWLNDKERKYPVVIDPTIILDVGRTNTIDCYVDNSQPSTAFPGDYYLYAGHSTLGKTRTFVKFTLPALPDNCAIIQNASIHFLQRAADTTSTTTYLNLYNITSSWSNDGSVKWNSQPSYDDKIVIDYAKIKSGSNFWYSFDITKSVKEWYESTSTNYGVALVSSNESVVNRVQLYSAENYSGDLYPQISVVYRNNIGLESYWSYSSYSNDTAGAAYINDYTGNLVYELPILSSISEVMPLTLSAYYNTYTANKKFVAGKGGSSATTVGKGFRLNVQQTVLPSDQYNMSTTDATTYPYVYTDADGTEHYIKKTTENGATVYKDEDGLGLTLTVSSSGDCRYKLTDKTNNQWLFNNQGNLYCQKDSNGNSIQIKFKATASNFEANQMIDYIIDGAGHKFTFDYYTNSAGEYNGYIKTITDNAGRVITFTTTSGLLRKVTYSDSTYTTIAYCNQSAGTETDEGIIDYVQGFDGYALNFDYTSKATGRQLKTIKEYGRTASGSNVMSQRVTFDRTAYNKTVIRSAGVDGYHYAEDSTKGADDIVTTLQFDDFGRTISQQVSYGSGGEIGAGNYSYTSGASTLGSANKVSSSASLGKNTVNLLYNNGAETTGNWTGATTNATTSQGISTEQSYVGKKSFKLSNSSLSNANGGSYYYQGVTGLTGGGTYTFSAYVKVTSLTSIQSSNIAGASLALVSVGSANNITVFSSEKLTKVTDTAINNGWRRISVTMTLPSDATGIYAYLELRSVVGTAYFDNIQLEAGSVANSCNLLENSSFEKQSSNSPTSWSNAGSFTIATNSSGTVLDGSTNKGHKNGSRCLRVTGDPGKAKGMSQSVAVKGNENDTYIVSGWGGAYAVNISCHEDVEPKFEIAVRVTYTRTKTSDGTTATVTQYKEPAKFNTTITGWQYSSTSFSLKYTNPASGYTYTPTHILVMPRYNYQSNYAHFDHIQLIKDVSESYTYDNKGNLISTGNAEQKVNTTYNSANDLTSYTDTAGYKSTATYDSKHNLLTTKSAKGVVTSNTYNANGTISATEIQNSANTEAIKTSYGYHGGNSTYGIKSGSYLKYQYDENGNKVQTNCTWESGIPTQTFYDNGATTTYGYNNSIKSRLTSVTHEGTQVNYDYVNRSGVLSSRISKITYTGTASGSPSENYSFNYDDYGNVLKTMVGSQALSTNTYAEKNGALTTTTYGNGDKRTYNYNKLGLVSSIVSINDGTSKTSYSWGYNDSGRTMYHRDAENNLKYLYDYDSLGRLIRQEIQTNDTFSHVGSTEVAYDVRNNVTKIASEFGGYTAKDEYMYSSSSGATDAANSAKDNLISRYRIAGSRTVDYSYDSLNRLTQKKLTTTTPIYTNYTYKASDLGGKYTTTMLETEKLDNTTYKYYYDSVGNITKIDKGSSAYRTYTYDKKNQLLSEVNSTSGITTNFTYDAIGNITKKVQSGAVSKTINYRYGNDGKTGWNNLLTGVDLSGNGAYESNETITYDNIGNPTTYFGANLSWYGRQLKSYSVNGTTVNYTYDADGLRTSLSIPGLNCTYQYVGGQLRYETRGNLKFYYFYDASGNLSAIRYYDANGKSYAYFALTNAQGDVVAFYTGSGVCVVTYEYDAWGNVVKQTDTSGINFAELNLIRYRGYYYDSSIGLYYLQSRYYNPKVGRFLNSDSISDQSAGILGYNTYIYASNNPINFSDPTGHSIIGAIILGSVFGAIASGVSEFICQMIDNKGNINDVSWKKVGRSALIGGVCGGVSGGVGGFVSSLGASRAISTATDIALGGIANLAETIWDKGFNVKVSECANSFLSGTISATAGTIAGKCLQKANAKVFQGISNATKKVMLNCNSFGRTYTTAMVRNQTYLKDDAYFECISYGVGVASNATSAVATIFVNLFEEQDS